jgi:hypothetical protein
VSTKAFLRPPRVRATVTPVDRDEKLRDLGTSAGAAGIHAARSQAQATNSSHDSG